MDIVDIVLPLYKPDEKVYNAINSVINQTYSNWKLYIIDDASMDGSLACIKKSYEQYLEKIAYIQMTENKRAAACRNFALRQGVGKYIAFIDQDDVWVKDKLKRQIAFINETDYDAVHGNVKYIDKNGNIIMQEECEQENESRRKIDWANLAKEELARRLLITPNIRIISSLIKREAFDKIGGFNDKFFGGEDEIFWFEMAKSFKIGFIDNTLFHRVIHEKNTSTVFSIQRMSGYIEALKQIKRKNNNEYFSKDINLKIKSKYYSILLVSIKMRKVFMFIKYFLILLFSDPVFLTKEINNSKKRRLLVCKNVHVFNN